MQSLDRKLIRDLWLIRGQVLAIALVIAAAVATIVLSSGTYRSLELTRDRYYDRYYFGDIFASLKRAPDSLAAKIAAIPGVSREETRLRQYSLLDMPSVIEPVRGLIVSLAPEGQVRLNIPVLREGRWPRPDNPDEVLVHEAFAEGHGLHPGDHIRATINGKQRTLAVSGIALSPEFVYSLGPGDLVPDNKRFGVLWMNRKALAAAANLEGAFNDVSLRLQHSAAPEDVIAALDDILNPYGGTGAFLRKDQLSNAFVDSELHQLEMMTLIVPPIFLVTAVFLLNIAMSRLAETERQQIGLLKAIGYTDMAVGVHYLKTAVVIVLLGILLGWGAGMWMGQGMTRLYIEYFRFPILEYKVTPAVFLGAAAISLVAACAGTLFATRRSVLLAPAAAMMPPPPPVYRPSLLERIGVLRGITPSGQMVIRHLVRWPLRSAFTVLGIGLALALFLSMMNFYDSVDLMLDSYFFRNSRQDATVSFTDIRPDSAAQDLAHLPGVLGVELQRNVSARLVSGHISKRVAIRGLMEDAELSRPLDVHGKKIFLPPEGIVLNERLAGYLGVRVGGLLSVSILEGRMPERVVPVTGITAENIGLSAYMNRDALNRLLREGPVANTAVLMVDKANLGDFYRELKKMPYVAGVASQAAAISLFRKMIEKNIFVILSFYVIFSSVLAFGVVYNNTRLILSERSREFAMLRVLGFFKGEVASILGGEAALLTIFSLPLGCILGYALIVVIVAFFATDLYRLPFSVEPSTYGFAVITILVAAMASGVLAAYRLSEIDLLSVLKERE